MNIFGKPCYEAVKGVCRCGRSKGGGGRRREDSRRRDIHVNTVRERRVMHSLSLDSGSRVCSDIGRISRAAMRWWRSRRWRSKQRRRHDMSGCGVLVRSVFAKHVRLCGIGGEKRSRWSSEVVLYAAFFRGDSTHVDTQAYYACHVVGAAVPQAFAGGQHTRSRAYMAYTASLLPSQPVRVFSLQRDAIEGPPFQLTRPAEDYAEDSDVDPQATILMLMSTLMTTTMNRK